MYMMNFQVVADDGRRVGTFTIEIPIPPFIGLELMSGYGRIKITRVSLNWPDIGTPIWAIAELMPSDTWAG